MANFSRRDILMVGGAVATSWALSACSPSPKDPVASAQPVARGNRKRALRLAHITDVHVQPEKGAGQGFAKCLNHLQSLADPPRLILQGGDAVMDACGVEAPRAKEQADLFKRVLKAECSLPIEHCLGNHDIWGLEKIASATKGTEPNWGKAWGMDFLGLNNRYRTFDRNGWRFIVLDSVTMGNDTYVGKLDEEQFAWLSRTLESTDKKMPVLVLSHIPILAASVFFDGNLEKTGNWVVPAGYMHIDARAIKNLFHKHPNVKVCLSGHLHLVDRVDYLGVTYLCNGAVSANWWKGQHQEFREGYGIVDLFDDGTIEHQYVEYGWTAREA